MMQSLWDTIMESPVGMITVIIVVFAIEMVALSIHSNYHSRQKEQAIEEWQDKGGNVYLNGILQKSELDPDGLDLDKFKVEYWNGKLYIQNK